MIPNIHETTTLGNCDDYVHAIYITKPCDKNIDNSPTNIYFITFFANGYSSAYING